MGQTNAGREGVGQADWPPTRRQTAPHFSRLLCRRCVKWQHFNQRHDLRQHALLPFRQGGCSQNFLKGDRCDTAVEVTDSGQKCIGMAAQVVNQDIAVND